jgi:hypothetical protein
MTDMNDFAPFVFGFSAIAFAIFMLFAIPKFDRQRIREHVEANGGKVVDIAGRWFGRVGGRSRTYDVTYKTRHGKSITATCVTSMMSGVHWVSGRLPGSAMETSESRS